MHLTRNALYHCHKSVDSVPALHSEQLRLLRASGRMLTNERTNQQTRRITIRPGGDNTCLGEMPEKLRGNFWTHTVHVSGFWLGGGLPPTQICNRTHLGDFDPIVLCPPYLQIQGYPTAIDGWIPISYLILTRVYRCMVYYYTTKSKYCPPVENMTAAHLQAKRAVTAGSDAYKRRRRRRLPDHTHGI